jgi:ribosomal protein S11
MNETDVRIGDVQTEMVVTESVGSLGVEDVKRLIDMAMQQFRNYEAHP